MILGNMTVSLVLTPAYFEERGCAKPHFKLTLQDIRGVEHNSLEMKRRIVWLPTERETDNHNWFFVTFALLGETLDPEEFDHTSFSYSSARIRHEWSSEDAAKHIYTYLTMQMLDGSVFR